MRWAVEFGRTQVVYMLFRCMADSSGCPAAGCDPARKVSGRVNEKNIQTVHPGRAGQLLLFRLPLCCSMIEAVKAHVSAGGIR